LTQSTEPLPGGGMHLNFAGLFIGFISGLPRLFLPLVAVLFGAGRSDNGVFFMPFIIAAVIGLSLFFRWLGWTRFRYFTGEEEIRIESGLISRSARSIPFERIQDVSVEQKPLARLFGLGEVKFETGSGTGDEGKLSYVSIAEAERLRELVRARKSGIVPDLAIGASPILAEDATGEPPLFAMDTGRVLKLGFYSFSLVIFAVLGGAAQQLDFLMPFDVYDIGAWLGVAKDNGTILNGIGLGQRIFGAIAALLALIAVGTITGVMRTFLREYGFRLDETAKGFRRRRGLLTLTDTVMPIHRVQAATILTGPVRKLRGWYALKFVSLAADSDTKKGEDSDHAAAPLATMDEIARILAAAQIDRADPDLPLKRGRSEWWLIQFALAAIAVLGGMAALILAANAGAKSGLLLVLLAFAAVTFHFQWRNNSYALDADQLFVRQGWWRERLTIAPQVKVQTVEIQQGPLARLRGLASIQLGIAGGTLEIIALPIDEARSIQAQISGVIAMVDYSRIGPRG
jgi:putative membrane protein